MEPRFYACAAYAARAYWPGQMAEVVTTDEFREWFDSLDDGDSRSVARVVDLLEMLGVALPFPFSSALAGSRYPLRELRAQSGGRPLRVLYIFDPRRNAVLLIGGDKTGDDRFYQRMIPVAEGLWETFKKEQGFK
jgi:hypothetical protein